MFKAENIKTPELKAFETKYLDGQNKSDFTDAEILEKVKAETIKTIDTQTALEIEALVGDNNKQKDLLAEANTLARREARRLATEEQSLRLDELEALNGQVLDLKYSGNNRENIVKLVEITTTLENAIAEIEAI